jgi:hypothetical protein
MVQNNNRRPQPQKPAPKTVTITNHVTITNIVKAAEAPRTNRVIAPYVPPPVVKVDPEKVAAAQTKVSQNKLAFEEGKAEAGEPWALASLGRRYLKGDGVGKDQAKGRAYLRQAAEAGDNQALQTLLNSDYPETKTDSDGHVIESPTARQEFMKKSGYPNGRSGYALMHVKPIKEGGQDSPDNLEWVSLEEARQRGGW